MKKFFLQYPKTAIAITWIFHVECLALRESFSAIFVCMCSAVKPYSDHSFQVMHSSITSQEFIPVLALCCFLELRNLSHDITKKYLATVYHTYFHYHLSYRVFLYSLSAVWHRILLFTNLYIVVCTICRSAYNPRTEYTVHKKYVIHTKLSKKCKPHEHIKIFNFSYNKGVKHDSRINPPTPAWF